MVSISLHQPVSDSKVGFNPSGTQYRPEILNSQEESQNSFSPEHQCWRSWARWLCQDILSSDGDTVSQNPLPDSIIPFSNLICSLILCQKRGKTPSRVSVQVQVNVRRMGLFWEVSLGFFCCCFFPGIGLACGAG